MPLFTSARSYTRMSSARTRGFNGYAGSTETFEVVEASGVLLSGETSVPGFGATWTSPPIYERLSASSRFGDRVTFSVSVIGFTSGFSVDPTYNLGSVLVNCSGDFNWSVSVSYEGPACGKIRVTGVSGSSTVYGGASHWQYFPGTAPSGPISESGTDYSETGGAREFQTMEAASVPGVPWSDWQSL